jgi:hypothetical protein
VGPGDFVLPEPAIGLTSLASYRATLAVSFAGMETGKPAEWSVVSSMVKAGEAGGLHLTVLATGAGAPRDSIEMWERNGIRYESSPGEACSGRVIEATESPVAAAEPAAELIGMVGASGVGQGSVNGVDASHYTVDERALGLAGLAVSAGELWVATDGGYIVSYQVTTQAAADYFGPDTEGKMSWDYQLTDVNQALDMELPADCPPGLLDAPLMDDATDVNSVPGVVRYRTTATVADVLEFYQSRAAALGWTIVSGPFTSDTGGVLESSSAAGPITIFALDGDDGVTVLITNTESSVLDR